MASCKFLRNLTRNNGSWSPVQKLLLNQQNMVSQRVFIDYQDFLPKFLNNTLSHRRFEEIPQVRDHLRKMLDYNVIGGKQLRGLLMLFSYETLMKPSKLNDELWEDAFKLAWAIEILQAILVIWDDVDDKAELRRGQKCWHLLPSVGKFVVNDIGMMTSFLFETLRQHFGNKPHYGDIINLFNETFLNTSAGQHIDMAVTYSKRPDCFTETYYRLVSILKTGHYTFRFPILLALIHSQKATKESYEYVDKFCEDVGIALQMQNDFMDYYIDENTMGKTGTDIPTGKLCWPAVEALKRCNPIQLKEFQSCYGRPDQAYVERIQNLYLELNIPQLYRELEKTSYDMYLKRINDLPPGAVPPPEVFLKTVDMIHKKTQVISYA